MYVFVPAWKVSQEREKERVACLLIYTEQTLYTVRFEYNKGACLSSVITRGAVCVTTSSDSTSNYCRYLSDEPLSLSLWVEEKDASSLSANERQKAFDEDPRRTHENGKFDNQNFVNYFLLGFIRLLIQKYCLYIGLCFKSY